MNLLEKILNEYPELAEKQFEEFSNIGSIRLQDDSDGEGAYIAKWEYKKPLPDGLSIGK
jgi:hypothetical protein